MNDQPGWLEQNGRIEPERTFTSTELALNQAAIVREAAELASANCSCPTHGMNRHHDCISCHNCGNGYRAILTIYTDQPALAAHDKELIERHLDHLVSMEGWIAPEALDRHDAELIDQRDIAARDELDRRVVEVRIDEHAKLCPRCSIVLSEKSGCARFIELLSALEDR